MWIRRILGNVTASATGAGSASLKVPTVGNKAYSVYAVGKAGTTALTTCTVN